MVRSAFGYTGLLSFLEIFVYLGVFGHIGRCLTQHNSCIRLWQSAPDEECPRQSRPSPTNFYETVPFCRKPKLSKIWNFHEFAALPNSPSALSSPGPHQTPSAYWSSTPMGRKTLNFISSGLRYIHLVVFKHCFIRSQLGVQNGDVTLAVGM